MGREEEERKREKERKREEETGEREVRGEEGKGRRGKRWCMDRFI